MKRASRAMSAQTRAKISATIRAARAADGSSCWTDERVEILRKAFFAGGHAAVRSAFPDLRHSQLYAAVTRYCSVRNVATTTEIKPASCWQDKQFIRRFMEALTGQPYTI